MKQCPHCGNTDSYHYVDRHALMYMQGIFEEGRWSEENVDFVYTGPRPKMGICDKCKKRFKLDKIDYQ